MAHQGKCSIFKRPSFSGRSCPGVETLFMPSTNLSRSVSSYAAHSPITFAAKVTTPLLIQHGENERVPIMQAHKFYKALKKMGKTVEMEIFPRGGHVLSEPAQQREIMRRNLEWFRRWLNP